MEADLMAKLWRNWRMNSMRRCSTCLYHFSVNFILIFRATSLVLNDRNYFDLWRLCYSFGEILFCMSVFIGRWQKSYILEVSKYFLVLKDL